eukprot:scaffold1440_cov377-Prasinococcus_capsulatus_cf.AAC.8
MWVNQALTSTVLTWGDWKFTSVAPQLYLRWYSLALLGKRGATGDDGESTRATERVLLAVRPLESLCAAALPTGTEVWKVGAADANMMLTTLHISTHGTQEAHCAGSPRPISCVRPAAVRGVAHERPAWPGPGACSRPRPHLSACVVSRPSPTRRGAAPRRESFASACGRHAGGPRRARSLHARAHHVPYRVRARAPPLHQQQQQQ